MRPKTYAVIRYLAERPGVLVKTDELMDAVWGDVAVSPATLSQSIRELRRALGDDARAPSFIETAHRRGFRFVARIADEPPPPRVPRVPLTMEDAETRLPGRAEELKRLEGLFEDAEDGRRRLVFVTGEPGIGKSRLIREFLDELAIRKTALPLHTATGDCVEYYGESESYGPVLSALDRLARAEPDLKDVLRSSAPSWLVQLPWLLDDEENSGLQARLTNSTSTRMLRELCVALETFTADRTLVLWIEDLHWSDPSTIDLLAALAGRPEPARLLVLCSYRPVDAAMSAHPVARVKRRVCQEGLATELALGYLDEEAIEKYLWECFGELRGASDLAALVREQTEGNPLFMVSLADHMVTEGWLTRTDGSWVLTVDAEELRSSAPDSVRTVIEARIADMSAEHVQVLEVASAVGETFDSQAVASVLGIETGAVEQTCARLASWGSLVEEAGRSHWPDGSRGQRYRFLHAAFRQILYEHSAAARIQEIHLRIGECLEAAFEREAEPPFAELALHFERGGDPARAVDWLVRNAAQVRRRFAEREAVTCLQSALELLERLPDGEDRARRELKIRFGLAKALNLAVSFGSDEQQANLARAREICVRLVDRTNLALILSWQSRLEFARGNPRAMRAIGEMQRTIAPHLDRELAMQIQQQGVSAGIEGALAEAEENFNRTSAGLAAADPLESIARFGQDPATNALAFAGVLAWLRGYPEQARQRIDAARSRADEAGDPMGVATATLIAGQVEHFRRDLDAVRALQASLAALTEDFGFGFPYAPFHTTHGWVLLQDGEHERAVASLRQGSDAVRAAGTIFYLSILLGTLAEAHLAQGAVPEGLDAIEQGLAFVEASGERLWESELRRLRGELLARDGEDATAESAVRKALDIAVSQGARSLELRAAMSLARLCHGGSRETEAYSRLQGILEEFTEGFDTADLRDGKALLAAQ